jgi:hypothetical protein
MAEHADAATAQSGDAFFEQNIQASLDHQCEQPRRRRDSGRIKKS